MTGGRDPERDPGGRRRLPWSLRIMLAASVLLPLLILVLAGWHRYDRLMAEARAEADRLSAVAREHALKVVETNALVLDRMEDRIRGLSWAEVEAQGEALHRWLRTLDEAIAQIIALHIVRPDGATMVLSLEWPTPPLDLSGRGYFRDLAGGETGLVFGRPFRSPLTGQVSVVVARAIRGPGGTFGGAVLGALLASYFEAQWRAMDPSGRAEFGLLRPDGLPRLESAGAGRPAPAATDAAGAADHPLVMLRPVGPYPLQVRVALSVGHVRAAWWRSVAALAAGCLLAAAVLGFATLQAVRRWRFEERSRVELQAEIGRREEAEAGLLQSQRLESLGRLTGGVAHDFNNLLTAILGTVQLLEKHLGAAADDRTRRLLGMARDAVRRGAELNRSLLAFARRQKLRTAALNANALVESFAPLLQRAVGEAVRLELDLAAGLPPGRADAAQLESALLNLAINARDAMPRGGTLRISTRRLELDARQLAGNPDAQPGPYVALAVRDSGTGMPPEVLDRAFEPFFTTKPAGQGTGLGLSQVFGFLRQLGGHVAISSAPGSGTTVTLFLPAAAAEPQPRPAPAPAPLPRAGGAALPGRVLLVEDDPRVLEVTAETLREAGFGILTASDGPAALALLRRGEAVDLLFSDIVMPGGMSGVELAVAARQLRPGLPVLLASGHAGPGPAVEAFGFEVLAKPYDQVMLARRLEEFLAATQPSPA